MTLQWQGQRTTWPRKVANVADERATGTKAGHQHYRHSPGHRWERKLARQKAKDERR